MQWLFYGNRGQVLGGAQARNTYFEINFETRIALIV
jgi:hypothetical protein